MSVASKRGRRAAFYGASEWDADILNPYPVEDQARHQEWRKAFLDEVEAAAWQNHLDPAPEPSPVRLSPEQFAALARWIEASAAVAFSTSPNLAVQELEFSRDAARKALVEGDE
jgi:hypothetical protein